MATSPQVDDLSRQSTFTFVGTVKELNAATMAEEVPVTQNTAVVHVDQVLQAPPMLANRDGTDITVLLRAAEQVPEGQQATFFTTGWIYGEDIAVQEVGHVEGRVDDERAAELAVLSPGTPENRTHRLQQRLAGADVVVLGMVSEIKFPEGYDTHGPVSEHAPLLRQATIQIETVYKGDLPADQDMVQAIFFESQDIRWHRTPILDVGQKGIFVLDKREIQELQREEYAALDPLDYQLPEQRDLIETLLQQGS